MHLIIVFAFSLDSMSYIYILLLSSVFLFWFNNIQIWYILNIIINSVVVEEKRRERVIDVVVFDGVGVDDVGVCVGKEDSERDGGAESGPATSLLGGAQG